MFKELLPVLRDRGSIDDSHACRCGSDSGQHCAEEAQDGDNDALTTPLSVTALPEEIDASVVDHYRLVVPICNEEHLEEAKAEMDAASKAAQAEAAQSRRRWLRLRRQSQTSPSLPNP